MGNGTGRDDSGCKGPELSSANSKSQCGWRGGKKPRVGRWELKWEGVGEQGCVFLVSVASLCLSFHTCTWRLLAISPVTCKV